jgi:hypothetical protein
MPKLPSQAASAAKAAAESSGFTAIEEGTYEARLTGVVAKNAKSSGNPMWVWELEIVEAPYRGRKLWVNTVLTDNAMWKVGEMFAAFGVDTDTDTDELVGDHCLVDVVQRVIEGGARAGQTGNDVQRAHPLVAAGEASAAVPSGSPSGTAEGSEAAEGDGGW